MRPDFQVMIFMEMLWRPRLLSIVEKVKEDVTIQIRHFHMQLKLEQFHNFQNSIN